jgi:hypothetical protein
VGDHEEALQNAKGEGRDGEEVHGGDGLAMVAESGRSVKRMPKFSVTISRAASMLLNAKRRSMLSSRN